MYLTEVQVIDDSSLQFMRTGGKVKQNGISVQISQDLPLTRTIPNTDTYYECKFKLGNNKIEYIVHRNKIDWLFGIIGGVFFFWFVIVGWIGKLYNTSNVREKLSHELYLN